HRAVKQLLRRLGHAVNLVDEEHVSRGQAGEDRREVAGPLDRRSAGHPDARPELRGDDVGQRGLAEAGRPGQEDVIGRRPPPDRALQQQFELVAHPILGDELGQPPRPDARFHLAFGVTGVRRHHRFDVAHRVLPNIRIACLSSSGTGGIGSWTLSATAATAWLACAVLHPSPTRAWRTCSCQSAATPPVAPSPPTTTGPMRSRSSSTSRSAPFLPIPGTWVRVAVSPEAIARRTVSGLCTASIACASRGPTPLAVCSSSKSCFSSSVANPYRV